MSMHHLMASALLFLSGGVYSLAAPPEESPRVVQHDDGTVLAGGKKYSGWIEYIRSDFFLDNGMRCGTRIVPPAGAGGSGSDCTYTFTNPSPVYDPSVVKYQIPVVVHVIRNSSGTQGNVSESQVESQIEILNEDFLALLGSNGQDGTDIQIEFYLATTDPNGSPTNGITYSNNTTWFNDGGGYYNSLAWNTNNYLNIYTNTASGNLGYVPDLPQGGIAGSNADRVVILWEAFGANAPIGPPFNLGRTATHEVGHYFGLEHTFYNGCGSSSACYTTGDLICDTNPESSPTIGCGGSSCGSVDPYTNYMDYSNDSCMEEFTPEQARRMRCSLEFYRPNLWELAEQGGACCFPGGECVDDYEQPDCETLGGTFAGDSTACASFDCSSLTGACCFTSGSCTVIAEGTCATAGGVYQGNGTNCSQVSCEASGACCFSGGECVDDYEQENCESLGGAWAGGGATCASFDCSSLIGACCLTTGTCTVLDEGTCSLAGGIYQGNGSTCGDTACGSDCVEDLTADGDVGFNDLLLLLSGWGPCPDCPEDLDGSGDVGFNDLLLMLSAWGPCVP